jgi:hypothetical protein
MRIEVWDGSCKADKGLANYVGLRLMSVLDHHVRCVDRVTVYVVDCDQRYGKTPSRCRMLAWLRPAGQVLVVQDTREGLYAVIDRTAEQLADGVTLASASPTAATVARPRRSVHADTGHPPMVAAATRR